MFKFLRKYNKFILSIGGTLLVIVFLVPTLITRLSQSAASLGENVATVGDNEDVSRQEWRQVQEEMLFIQRRGQPFARYRIVLTEPEHWFLLVREAQQAGLVGLSPRAQATPEQIMDEAAQSGKSVGFLDRALTRQIAVDSMLQLYANAGRLSDRRLRKEAERLLHQVQATLVVIEASAENVDDTYTDHQLQEQLDLHADMLPGEGDLGFGYKLPDRAKLEWLSIPALSVRRMIEADGETLNGIALRRHWRKFANQDGLPALIGTSEIPDVVRDHFISMLSRQKLDEIAKWASGELQIPRRGFSQRAGYIELPDDWASRQLKLDVLAQKIRDKFKGLELPSYHSTGDAWHSASDLDELEAIGTATTDKFGPPMKASTIAFAAKEFGGSTSIFLQAHVAGPPLRERDDSIHIFRIIETEPSREPNSLDEVRDALIADLRKMADYERLKRDLSNIEAMAQSESLLAVAMTHATIVQNQSPVFLSSPLFQPLQLFSFPLPVIGPHVETMGRIVDHALTLPRNRAAADLPLQQRSFAFPVDDILAIVVVRIDDQTPLIEPTYDLLVRTGQIQDLLRFEELESGESVTKAFSLEALIKRHNFAYIRPANESDDDAATLQAAVADSSEN